MNEHKVYWNSPQFPNHARLRPRRQLSEARILLYVQLFYQIHQLHALLPQSRAGFLASYSAPSRRLSDFLAECGRLWPVRKARSGMLSALGQ